MGMPQNPCLLVALGLATIFIAALLSMSYTGVSPLCSPLLSYSSNSHPIQLSAILHYATTSITPQQSFSEINLTYSVLLHRAPCNFLVFGLGHDSLMWAALNPGGRTLFLEEDPKWLHSVLSSAPYLNAHAVQYETKLSQAENLINSHRSYPDCEMGETLLESKCPLAIKRFPREVYETEWDVIMVDAPRGYFDSAPGRMGAIYSVAVMARRRRGAGTTDVFVHDVNRKVEKRYSEEFLCRKYLVEGTGRLWHFRIPPSNAMEGKPFC
ncbi:hypothetical protein AMTR_s00013p00174150 [Amborella trichopoda]|uniref:Uncharacterized protein n=2 Tax=Amborella trichopoda TaxID=13333 RepID=W1PPC6_AMBTC|nr:hypothetical protein AMTR_s00013p00174150 [Amborella trichopoda]